MRKEKTPLADALNKRDARRWQFFYSEYIDNLSFKIFLRVTFLVTKCFLLGASFWKVFKDGANFFYNLTWCRIFQTEFELGGNIYIKVVSRRAAFANYHDATGKYSLAWKPFTTGEFAEVDINFRTRQKLLNLRGRHVFNRLPVNFGRDIDKLFCDFKSLFGIVGYKIFFFRQIDMLSSAQKSLAHMCFDGRNLRYPI